MDPGKKKVPMGLVATLGLLGGKPRQATALISTFSTILAHSTPFPTLSYLGAQYYIVTLFYRF